MSMFYRAMRFNQDISRWDTSAVEDMSVQMSYMFYHASLFNQNLEGWDVSRVREMRLMFKGATSLRHNMPLLWSTGGFIVDSYEKQVSSVTLVFCVCVQSY